MKRGWVLASLIVIIITSFIVPYQIFAQAQQAPSDQSADLTSTAAVATPHAEASSDIVNDNSWYLVTFKTATAGAIKKVDMAFPAGYTFPQGPRLISSSGIGFGTLSLSGTTLTFTVSAASPPIIAAGKTLTFMISEVQNPIAATYSVTIDTKTATSTIIDGPTSTPALPFTMITNAMLAANSVDSSKIVAGSITGGNIASGTIGASNLGVSSPTGAQLGGLTTANLSPTAGITGGQIAAGAITGSNIASGVALSGSASIDSPTFTVDSVNHRVGIGTTTPFLPLDVEGSNLGPLWVGTSANQNYFTISAGTKNPFSASLTENVIGGHAKWDAGALGTSGGAYDYSILNQQNHVTPFMIDGSSNNIGIGTSTPQRSLSIQDTMNVDQANASSGTGTDLAFGSGSGEGIGSKRTSGGNQFGLDFYTSSANRMSITNAGNVGIGTNAPNGPLDVRGDLLVGNIPNRAFPNNNAIVCQ